MCACVCRRARGSACRHATALVKFSVTPSTPGPLCHTQYSVTASHMQRQLSSSRTCSLSPSPPGPINKEREALFPYLCMQRGLVSASLSDGVWIYVSDNRRHLFMDFRLWSVCSCKFQTSAQTNGWTPAPRAPGYLGVRS